MNVCIYFNPRSPVSDSYQEKVMEGLLPRVSFSSRTGEFSFDMVTNIGNDSGSYNYSHELLLSPAAE